MKYRDSKREIDPLEPLERYYDVRYQYNGKKYRVVLGAKNITHAKEKFIPLHHEDSVVHSVSYNNSKSLIIKEK